MNVMLSKLNSIGMSKSLKINVGKITAQFKSALEAPFHIDFYIKQFIQ